MVLAKRFEESYEFAYTIFYSVKESVRWKLERKLRESANLMNQHDRNGMN